MNRTATTPAWARRDDLVVCVGGPRDGAWYYAGDLAEAEHAALTVAARTGRPAPSHGYRDTGQLRPHPHHDAVGHVHRWQHIDVTVPAWRSVWCQIDDHDECHHRGLASTGTPGVYAVPGDPEAGTTTCGCACHPATAGRPVVTPLPTPVAPHSATRDVRPAYLLAG